MPWLIFEILSILLFSVSTVLQKILIKDDKSDPHTYSIVFQILGAMIVGSFALFRGFNLPPITEHPINFLLMGVLYGSGTLFLFNALKNIEASEVTIFTSIRPAFTIFSAVLLLNEPFSLNRGIGTLLILGAVVLISGKIKGIKFKKGMLYAVGMAFTYGLAITNDTYILKEFSDVVSFLFIGFLFPGLFLIILKPTALLNLNQFLKPSRISKMFLFTFLYAISALFFYLAIKNGALASQIAPVHQSTVVTTVVLAYLFLKERDQMGKKILASILVIFGVVLLT